MTTQAFSLASQADGLSQPHLPIRLLSGAEAPCRISDRKGIVYRDVLDTVTGWL